MSTRRSFQITHRHYQVHCCVYSQEIEEWKKQSLTQKLDEGQAIIGCISNMIRNSVPKLFFWYLTDDVEAGQQCANYALMRRAGDKHNIQRLVVSGGGRTIMKPVWWEQAENNSGGGGGGGGGQWDSEISKTEWRSKIERGGVRVTRDGALDAHPSPSHVPRTPDTCNR